MTKSKHLTNRALISASGTGSINLTDTPATAVSDCEITDGTGSVSVEALGANASRLMVTGAQPDTWVTISYTLT